MLNSVRSACTFFGVKTTPSAVSLLMGGALTDAALAFDDMLRSSLSAAG